MCLCQVKTVNLPNTSSVADVLRRIGMPSNMKGYHFAVCAIRLCCEKPELMSQMMHGLYPAIAREFDTNVIAVERSLRYIIEITFEYGDIRELYDIFGDCVDEEKGKVTNGKFVKRITEIITNER